MNPFRKRSKSDAAKKRHKNGVNGLSGQPKIISSIDVAFSLPSVNDFRTSLLMPKMADRFSLLRMDDAPRGTPGANQENGYIGSGSVVNAIMGNGNLVNPHLVNGHTRDLSILEEFD